MRGETTWDECLGIVKYSYQRQEEDNTYYFVMDLGDNSTLRRVSWTAGWARSTYLQFCDVLVFYVTYKTNKLSLLHHLQFQGPHIFSFAMFWFFMLLTSVTSYAFCTIYHCKRHLQCILLEGTLLVDGTTKTFVWLFTQFCKWMFSRLPIAIITDQDAATCKAIGQVFPRADLGIACGMLKHWIKHLSKISLTLSLPRPVVLEMVEMWYTRRVSGRMAKYMSGIQCGAKVLVMNDVQETRTSGTTLMISMRI